MPPKSDDHPTPCGGPFWHGPHFDSARFALRLPSFFLCPHTTYLRCNRCPVSNAGSSLHRFGAKLQDTYINTERTLGLSSTHHTKRTQQTDHSHGHTASRLVSGHFSQAWLTTSGSLIPTSRIDDFNHTQNHRFWFHFVLIAYLPYTLATFIFGPTLRGTLVGQQNAHTVQPCRCPAFLRCRQHTGRQLD